VAGRQPTADSGSLDGFTNNVDSLTVGPDYASGTLDGSKKIGALVSADPLLTKLLPCSTKAIAACAIPSSRTVAPSSTAPADGGGKGALYFSL